MKTGKGFLMAVLAGSLLFYSLSPALSQQVIKVGSIPIVAEISLRTALKQGYFAQEGIKVEPEVGVGGGAAVAALIGGSTQMTHSAHISTFVARDGGFDVVIVAPYAQSDPSAIVVRAEAGITAAKQLEGKTVAVNVLKGINWLYAMEWMAKAGADPNRAQWTEIPFPSMVPAVRAGRVDGAYATEPFVTLEVEKGGLKVVSRPFIEIDPALEVSGLVATEKWAKPNAELLERFARALYRGMDYANANRDKWPEIVAGYTRLQPEWIAKMKMPQYRHPINLERLQAAADLSLKWGLLKKKLMVKDMVWPTALK